jgi:hypothetical protein
MKNRLPVGPGSRGGSWHDPEYRAAYHRAWRAAHPEYRERERLRRARGRSSTPADIVVPATYPRPLPLSAVTCVCECGCAESVVVVCGLCRDGHHQETA